MKYEKIIKGIFLERPNRFIAKVQIEGTEQTVHVKNTGRCKELLVPGCTVILEDFRDRPGFESRKTKFDLIAVYKITDGHENNPLLINMDSQAPNKVAAEWLALQDYDFIKPEYTYGNSRVDFYMEKQRPVPCHIQENRANKRPVPCHNPNQSNNTLQTQKCLMEVKGCTLERNGIGYFPDAPTERGVKHLHELTAAVQKGYKCFLAFVIQIPGVEVVLPNIETHPEFGTALEDAKAAGVEVLFLQCKVKEDEMFIEKTNGWCKK